MYNYILLPYDLDIIYLIDVNKCIHLVSGGTHGTSLRCCYEALLSRLLEISAIQISYNYY